MRDEWAFFLFGGLAVVAGMTIGLARYDAAAILIVASFVAVGCTLIGLGLGVVVTRHEVAYWENEARIAKKKMRESADAIENVLSTLETAMGDE